MSGYVHKGIEFCEKYDEFLKKRCTIENTYAKSLRKLIEAYEPKKKDTDENELVQLSLNARQLSDVL